jgi:sugar lactone lactonase YvrE
MNRFARNIFLPLAACAACAAAAIPPSGMAASFSTLIVTPLAVEGLTTDNAGYLYAPGRGDAGGNCPVYRVSMDHPALETVGVIPAAGCSPSGLAFGPDGQLYVTQGDRIYRFVPAATGPVPVATVFASGVTGTNGVAFDRDGNLWTGDGTTGLGRVWKITPDRVAHLMFRVQPMANSAGVGRSDVTLPPGTAQPLVANGLQFTSSGDLLIADTARGALWKVAINRDGSIAAPMGCDTTFPADTLCLDNVFVAHPLLDGIDGFVLDVAGNAWASVNERNAIVFVSSQGDVQEVFRNPVAASGLRNEGPLESPTSPVLAGTRLCTANSDGNRRDNSPNTAGEIKPTGPDRGKISCMDARATIRGMTLPVH